MAKKRLYDIYDGGKLIQTNILAEDIADKFHITVKHVQQYSCLGRKINKRYTIIPVGWAEAKRKYKNVPKETPLVERIAWHLKVYGNTTTDHNPVEYADELKNMGFDFTITEHTDPRRTDVARGRKPKPKIHYLLEVSNANRKCASV